MSALKDSPDLFQPERKQVVVTGIASWYAFWFAAAAVAGIVNLLAELATHAKTFDSLIQFLILTILMITHKVAKVRMIEVGRFAAALWSKPGPSRQR
jgi:hypothetical protein